jgi:hypothetical protein
VAQHRGSGTRGAVPQCLATRIADVPILKKTSRSLGNDSKLTAEGRRLVIWDCRCSRQAQALAPVNHHLTYH